VCAIVKQIGADKMVANFLAVLIGQRRTVSEVLATLDQFKQELDRRMGIAEEGAFGSRNLFFGGNKKSLEPHLGRYRTRLSGHNIHRHHLLGGVVVRVAARSMRGSLPGRLTTMRQELARRAELVHGVHG